MRNADFAKLNRLVAGLKESPHTQYQDHLRYVMRHLEATPAFKAQLQLIDDGSDIQVDDWVKRNFGRRTLHRWPDGSADHLKIVLTLARSCVAEPFNSPVAVGNQFTHGGNLRDAVVAFTAEVIDPILRFIKANVDVQLTTLHTFERLRRHMEWFECDRLHFDDAVPEEATYDRRTREFLFAEGIDYPLSQASSPSGRVDVVAAVDSEDPVICEIKLYDGASKSISNIAQGLRQALQYAKDYGKDAAYLVVFNFSDDILEFETDADGTLPPCLRVEHVAVYIIQIRAKRQPSASKDKRRSVRRVKREELTKVDHAGRQTRQKPA